MKFSLKLKFNLKVQASTTWYGPSHPTPHVTPPSHSGWHDGHKYFARHSPSPLASRGSVAVATVGWSRNPRKKNDLPLPRYTRRACQCKSKVLRLTTRILRFCSATIITAA